MFPVRAVNQILIEPLCKSVDRCAKTTARARTIIPDANLRSHFS